MSYFTHLPSELIQIILNYLPINSYVKLYEYRQFQRILDTPFFWLPLYIKELSHFDFKLWNKFESKDFYEYYNDYIKLQQVSKKAQDYLNLNDIKLDCKDRRRLCGFVLTKLNYVKNFKVITLSSNPLEGDLLKEVTRLWLLSYDDSSIELSVYHSIHGYLFSIEYGVNIKQYKVEYRDVFNLIVELIYYNRL